MPGAHRPGMIARLAGFVVRRRRAVLVTVVLLALIGGSSGSTLFDRLSAGGWDDPNAESGQAAEFLEESFGQGQPNLVLLAHTQAGVDDPAAAAARPQLS
jgi:putative drug exporter of the RND superfamily